MPDPLFKYIGAKQNLAPQIISNMPEHSTYIEVFGGGLSVFWAKPKADWNIVNDINGSIINLYRVVANEETKKRFINKLIFTPYSRQLFDEFDSLYYNKEKFEKLDIVDQAIIYYYLIKTVFNGNINTRSISTGAQYTTAWGMKNVELVENAFKFLNSDFNGKRPVFIENLSYDKLLQKYVVTQNDEKIYKGIFVYLDPPYYVTNKVAYYEKNKEAGIDFNFNVEEHIKLRDLIDVCAEKVKVMISYDDVPEIRNLYKNYYIYETKALAQTSSTSDVKVVKKEVLITNYDVNLANGLFGATI